MCVCVCVQLCFRKHFTHRFRCTCQRTNSVESWARVSDGKHKALCNFIFRTNEEELVPQRSHRKALLEGGWCRREMSSQIFPRSLPLFRSGPSAPSNQRNVLQLHKPGQLRSGLVGWRPLLTSISGVGLPYLLLVNQQGAIKT